MAQNHTTRCDGCGKNTTTGEAKSKWWSVHLSRGNPAVDRVLDVCPDCLPFPLKSSGLKEFLKRVADRVFGS